MRLKKIRVKIYIPLQFYKINSKLLQSVPFFYHLFRRLLTFKKNFLTFGLKVKNNHPE